MVRYVSGKYCGFLIELYDFMSFIFGIIDLMNFYLILMSNLERLYEFRFLL